MLWEIWYHLYNLTNKFEWMLDDIRKEKIILAPIWDTNSF